MVVVVVAITTIDDNDYCHYREHSPSLIVKDYDRRGSSEWRVSTTAWAAIGLVGYLRHGSLSGGGSLGREEARSVVAMNLGKKKNWATRTISVSATPTGNRHNNNCQSVALVLGSVAGDQAK